MTRNTKIALGCGGAGCLGLIVVVIAVAVMIVAGVIKAPGIYDPGPNRNYNSNYNSNSSYNYNSNSNSSNTNTNSSSSSSSSMSDGDKHKLFQAAGITKDAELIQKVMRKLGFLTDSGLSDDYAPFVRDHVDWARDNMAFVRSVLNEADARAYVEAHIDD